MDSKEHGSMLATPTSSADSGKEVVVCKVRCPSPDSGAWRVGVGGGGLGKKNFKNRQANHQYEGLFPTQGAKRRFDDEIWPKRHMVRRR